MAFTVDSALREKGIELKAKRYGVWLRTKCPFAGCAGKKQKRLNLAVKLASDSIGYKCHRCGASFAAAIANGLPPAYLHPIMH